MVKIARISKNTPIFVEIRIIVCWDAFFAEKKTPGHGDTVEKGLGPRPLGPIGPTFRRTITVTGNVKKRYFF